MCLWPAGSRGSLRAAEEQSSDFILTDFILIKCIRWNGPTCRGDGPVGAAGKMFQRGREHLLGHLGDERCAQAHGEARQHRAHLLLRQVSVAVCEWIPSDAWAAQGRSGQGRARCRSTFVHVSEHAHHQLLLVVALRQQRIAEQIRHRVPIPRDMRLLGPGGACCRGSRGMSVRRLL